MKSLLKRLRFGFSEVDTTLSLKEMIPVVLVISTGALFYLWIQFLSNV